MVLSEDSTAFDVLAYLCALLDKEDERECAIQWSAAAPRHIKNALNKYKEFLDIILKSSLNEYRFTISDIEYLSSELKQLKQEKESKKHEIYILATEVERRIEKYSMWQNENVIYEVKPLNTNVDLTDVFIYPCTHPHWNQSKSERNRERTLNASFANYIMIRKSDSKPFEVVMHYWNDKGLLKKTEQGWSMSVALSPVMDYAILNTKSHDTSKGEVICVEGLNNGDTVFEKVLKVFDDMFEQQYGIIVFPEALGTREIVLEIKKRMRLHPEYCTFVLLPTICENNENTLIVLGPGGIDCLFQNKVAPFILYDKNGDCYREELLYDKQINLLITEELGLVAFAICADLLDPDYYNVITNVAKVDTIICTSFSPGGNAFKEAMIKSVPLRLLQIYVNTCSAKISSRSGMFEGEVAMVQLPYVKDESPLRVFEKKCGGQCSDNICYFDLSICYQNEVFVIEGIHKCA